MALDRGLGGSRLGIFFDSKYVEPSPDALSLEEPLHLRSVSPVRKQNAWQLPLGR